MNKTLMLVICDFLLLSMLALARFDPPQESTQATLDDSTSTAAAEAELIHLLEETLESELESSSGLSKDLDQTRKNLKNQTQKLAEREAKLAETQRILEEKAAEAARLATAKQNIEAEQKALAAEKARVEAERLELAQRFESARTKLEEANNEQIELIQTLGQLKEKSSVSKERLSQTEKDLLAREVALAQRESELKAAQTKAKELQSERETLQQQLQVARAERTLLEQTLSKELQEKQQLQTEKAQVLAHADRLTQNVTELGAGVSQLGQGVSELAQASEDIKKEIDANRPRTMNEIFTRFQKNRVTIRFASTEKPRFGSPDINYYESKSVLISDATKTYLVTHIADTPFDFRKSPESLQSVRMEIFLSGRTFSLAKVLFHHKDPRILFIPIPEYIIKATDTEIYDLALQPDRWEEAVLIKNDGSNFGNAEFRRLPQSDQFLKMSRPVLGELLNDFASSRGDLVFSKNNQFIGLLADDKHAIVINDLRTAEVVNIGSAFDMQKYAALSRRLKDQLQLMPEDVR